MMVMEVNRLLYLACVLNTVFNPKALRNMAHRPLDHRTQLMHHMWSHTSKFIAYDHFLSLYFATISEEL